MGMAVLNTLAAVLMMAASGSQPMFTDVTAASGIPPLKYAEGVNIVDLDGDGLPEIFLPNVKGRDRLFRNLGGCRFGDVTDEYGLTESGGIGAVFGDLDCDGLLDLYVVRGAYPYGENVLYMQDHGGRFVDVSKTSGAANRKNGISAAMEDVDGDGRLDIFASNWGVNTLYRNRAKSGAVSFEDITVKAGLAEEGKSWGSVFSDFDCDGLTDLFVVRGGFGKPEEGRLYIKRPDGTFADRTPQSGLKEARWSMGAAACDLDTDGDADLFITSYDGPDRLYMNDGKGRFSLKDGAGITSSRSVGAAAGDIDGDLLPDIVVAGYQGPVRVFRNLGGGKFKELKNAGIGNADRNEGIALADVDGDGDLDMYVANYDGDNRLYRNNAAPGPALKVSALSGKCAAAGAKIRLYKSGGLDDPKALLASHEVRAGYGFCSQSPFEAVFRLAENVKYDLSVSFPGGKKVMKKGVGPGQLVIQKP